MLLRQNRIVIDLEAIRSNYRTLSSAMPKGTCVMPVVKANAYGHGMVEVAKVVAGEGAACLAVALAEEGVLLRKAGIQTDILVFGAATERAAEEAVHYDLIQTVFEPHMVRVLNEIAQKLEKDAKVHIKLDTGMGRIGLREKSEGEALQAALDEAAYVKAVGIYTHFADADNPPEAGGMNCFSAKQLERFLELKACFSPDLMAHAANSALSLLAPEACFQMVREGIALYGYPPVKTPLLIQRALRWETEVVHVKTVPKGTSIGYGCTFVAPEEMRVATVAVGYGDGYHRKCSNRAQMLIGGKRANVVGRVCMDQTMLDVTDIDMVSVGMPVVLIGRQGEEEIGADEVARWADTISYEVLLAATNRVPREYIGD